MKEEVQKSLYEKFIQSVPVFTTYLSKDLQFQLTKVVDEFRFGSNSYVVEQGQLNKYSPLVSICSSGLYCLVEGEAEIQIEMQGKVYTIGKFKVRGHLSI